jgi:hypothetical protein
MNVREAVANIIDAYRAGQEAGLVLVTPGAIRLLDEHLPSILTGGRHDPHAAVCTCTGCAATRSYGAAMVAVGNGDHQMAAWRQRLGDAWFLAAEASLSAAAERSAAPVAEQEAER